jgi:hypothetical protein
MRPPPQQVHSTKDEERRFSIGIFESTEETTIQLTIILQRNWHASEQRDDIGSADPMG